MQVRFLSLPLALLALAACGGPEVRSGYVVSKDYSPESSYEIEECFAYSSNGSCTFELPMEQDIPASWSVTLRNCDLKEKPSDDCPTEDWDVSESQYNSIKIGQQLTFKK